MRARQKLKYSGKWLNHCSSGKDFLRNRCFKIAKRLIFQGIEFLLTGFSSQKRKEIEVQIHRHGGIILSDIPSPNLKKQRCSSSYWYLLPVILCPKKVIFQLLQNSFSFEFSFLMNFVLHITFRRMCMDVVQ